MITVIDYGIGNLASIVNLFNYIQVPCEVTSNVEMIVKASKILLPGVGAFDPAMRAICAKPGLKEVIFKKAVEEKIPLLGICLGMQLLTTGSEEGILPGLNLIPGRTKKFVPQETLKIPHMGWNTVSPQKHSALLQDLAKDSRFYFVHSYHVEVEDPAHILLKARYGIEFNAAIQKENVFGVQFHPEKSHRFGMALLKNFATL